MSSWISLHALLQALLDLCSVSEGWQPLLKLIADNILPAVFSSYYISAGTDALEFHQLPFFQVRMCVEVDSSSTWLTTIGLPVAQLSLKS
jgi:hypothetical protein